MADLIDRAALHHNAANVPMHGDCEQFYAILGEVARVIDAAPTIDAVPVVRCKDCRKRGTNKCPMYEDSEEIQMDWAGDDWFCSLGERMDADAPERGGGDAR